MDKNTFTGLFLMLIIIEGSVFLMRSTDEEIKRELLLQDSITIAKTAPAQANTITSNDTTTATNAPLQDSVIATGPFGSAKNGTESLVTIENELIKVNITNKGGRIKSVEIKGEKDYTGKPLILF